MRIRTRFQEGVAVVSIEGDVDMYTSPELRSALSELTGERVPRIVLDLGAVPFMDSSGIATLVQTLKEARPYGGEVRLAAPGKNVLRILELSNLMALFPIHGSVEEALRGEA